MIVRNAFMQYFSFKQFEKLYDSSDKADVSALYEALDKFLTHNNLIKSFSNHLTSQTNFCYYWNKYVDDSIEQNQKNKLFDDILQESISALKLSNNRYESYILLTNKISEGNFKSFELTEDLYDLENGERLKLQFNNWEPSLVKITPESNKSYKDVFKKAKSYLKF